MRFLLIPGAWMGSWVWDNVADGLRARDHDVDSITLSGLNGGEDVAGIDLSTHVDDVLTLLEQSDVRNVIVVGHSYSGLVAGQVADQAPERVIHTVFIDAFLPRDGKSLLDVAALDKEQELKLIDENQGRWPAPARDGLEQEEDLSAQQIDWLLDRFVDHPGRTISEPAVMSRPLSGFQATYIARTLPQASGSTADYAATLYGEPSWTFHELDAGHWSMISVPEKLVALLDEVATKAVT